MRLVARNCLLGSAAAKAKALDQIEAVTFNIAGMYGDLQGLVPALPPIARLELQAADEEDEVLAEAVS